MDMMEKTILNHDEAARVLQGFVDDVRAGKVWVINMRHWREINEKPVNEHSGMFKEFEPSTEYHIDITVINKENYYDKI